MTLGTFLKEKREAKGLTRKQLAIRCGISPVYILKVENNLTEVFAKGLFYKIAHYLDIDGAEFIARRPIIADVSIPD